MEIFNEVKKDAPYFKYCHRQETSLFSSSSEVY